MIEGPAGRIEVDINDPGDGRRGIALIAHPHPLMGGTKDNKVVTTLARALYALGLAALAGCFLWALPGVADYLSFMSRERTPVLELPFSVVYSVFFAAAVMVVLRCAASIAFPPDPARSGESEKA